MLIVVVRRALSVRTEAAFLAEMTLAGDEIHLDSEAIGILEQHRIVARGPAAFFGGMDNTSARMPRDKSVHGVDVVAASRAKAEVVESRGFLVEGPGALVGRGSSHDDARPRSDAVDGLVGTDQRFHLQEVTEVFPEGNALRGIVHRQLDMGNTVYFDAHEGLLLPGSVAGERRGRKGGGLHRAPGAH